MEDKNITPFATSSDPPVVQAPPTVYHAGATVSPGGNAGHVASIPSSIPIAAKGKMSKRIMIIIPLGLICVTLLAVGIGAKLFSNSKQVIDEESDISGPTLVIDNANKSVGIVAEKPSGLQIGAVVGTQPLGVANVRLGLATDASLPSLLLENENGNIWQVAQVDASLQFLQNGNMQAELDDSSLSVTHDLNTDGNTRLGNEATDTLTLHGVALSVPNNLNIAENALFIDSATKSVAIGDSKTNGFKLYVAGSFRADGPVLTNNGSASKPGFAWVGNDNTGIFRPAINNVGVSVAGQETLRVQPGAVLVLGGANLEVDGYIRAGRDATNPAWQVRRFVGSLGGAGSASVGHGVSDAKARILSASAWYKGNSGQAVPMTIEYVNDSEVSISGGIAGRAYRLVITYSQDSPSW